MTVVAYVPDLMDRSKVQAAAPSVTLARTPGDLLAVAGPGVTAVVDLSRPGVLDVLAPLVASGARVIGFGSHVDKDVLAAARSAGCEEVLARSAFFARLDELLA
jgi:hypothetical protein